MKSNNQGVKEETLIQTSRRVRDRQSGREDGGKAAAGGLGKVVACRLGGPTFMCR